MTSKFHTAQINPKDPLSKEDIAPSNGRELFTQLSQVAHGFSAADVQSAAVNLLVNVVRQNHDTRYAAERAFDEIVGGAKNLLLEKHYDMVGKRRNIFPFDQVIVPMRVEARSKG